MKLIWTGKLWRKTIVSRISTTCSACYQQTHSQKLCQERNEKRNAQYPCWIISYKNSKRVRTMRTTIVLSCKVFIHYQALVTSLNSSTLLLLLCSAVLSLFSRWEFNSFLYWVSRASSSSRASSTAIRRASSAERKRHKEWSRRLEISETFHFSV